MTPFSHLFIGNRPPSPQWRINASSFLLAFGALGVRWWVGSNSPVLCAGGGICCVPYNTNAIIDPIFSSPHLTPPLVSARANQCTQFASGLRPHPGRGGNANGGRRECGGGSEQPGGSVCRGLSDCFLCVFLIIIHQ
jgi:hypothetical protein